METNRLPKQALQYKQKWLQCIQILNKIDYQNKHYNTNKVATTCLKNGHKQNNKTCTTI